MNSPWKAAPFFLCFTALVVAQSDPGAQQKQQEDIDRRERRENQKIEQAAEQERIKLRTRERDELAKVQRESAVAAGAATATVVATGSLATVNVTRFAQLKFAEDEVRNLIQNQLTPEMDARFQKERNAVTRKFTLERAKLEAQQLTEGEDAATQRDRAVKIAEVSAKLQEQTDEVAVEQSLEEAMLRFAHTTKLNAVERDIAALTAKHLLEQSAKGTAAVYNPTADPEFTKLSAVRDAAKNALETALDELRAKFNVRRTDIDNAKEDELAKLNG